MIKWLLTIVALILVSLVIIDYKARLVDKESLSNKVNVIIEQNHQLVRENDSIRATIDHYQEIIDELKIRESILKTQSDTLNRRLKTIRNQYEEALNRPNNWTNDSIRWYFTNF